MMYLTSMHDTGLAIHPVHRVVCDVEKGAIEDFVLKARAYFDVETLDFDRVNRKQIEAASLSSAMTDANSTVIGRSLAGRQGLSRVSGERGRRRSPA